MTNNRFSYNPAMLKRRTRLAGIFATVSVALLGCALCAASDAPQWMRTAASGTLPSYDEKTDAVLLYSETDVTVISSDKIKTTVREAYKILRPNGREHGLVHVFLNPERKIKSLHG